MVKAQPGNVGIKGADRGLDGRLHFGKTGIVRVKAGENMGVSVIRDQKGAMERERGRDRHLPDLTEPTRPMTRSNAPRARKHRTVGAPGTSDRPNARTDPAVAANRGPLHRVAPAKGGVRPVTPPPRPCRRLP